MAVPGNPIERQKLQMELLQQAMAMEPVPAHGVKKDLAGMKKISAFFKPLPAASPVPPVEAAPVEATPEPHPIDLTIEPAPPAVDLANDADDEEAQPLLKRSRISLMSFAARATAAALDNSNAHKRRGKYAQHTPQAQQLAVQFYGMMQHANPKPSFGDVLGKLQEMPAYQNLARSTLQNWINQRDKPTSPHAKTCKAGVAPAEEEPAVESAEEEAEAASSDSEAYTSSEETSESPSESD